MKNIVKKLTIDQSLAILKIAALFLAVCTIISLLRVKPLCADDKGVVYIDESGDFYDFDSWDDFVKWTLQHKEKETDVYIDWGEH